MGDAEPQHNDEFERPEKLHTLPRNRRHREFNQFFKAMVRYMAESYNNSAVASAMEKLGRFGRFVPKKDPGPDESPLFRR